jgi:hypothetical protein
MFMNQELMILRGEYLTLQEQQKRNIEEIKALAERVKSLVQSFTKFGYAHPFQESRPPAENVQNWMGLSDRIYVLTQECHSIHARLEELKPMTGL